MELTNGYKRTDVGIIPNDWNLVRLETFTNRIGDGIHTTPQYSNDGEYSFINGNNLIDGKVSLSADTKRVSKEEYLIHKRLLDTSTILMSINGTIGNVAYFNNEKIILGKSAAYINLNTKVDKRLIYHLIQSNFTRKYFENELTGSTIKNLGLAAIRNTPIPLPPTLEEQTAIATALSDTDALISSLEKLIVKKRNINQGTMQELFKHKKSWEVKTYGEVFHFLSTANYSRAQLSANADIKYIHYGDIHTKWDEFLNISEAVLPTISSNQVNGYTLVEEGDIIMADASEDYEGIGKSVEVKQIKSTRVISGLHTFLLRDKSETFVDGFKGYIHLFPSVKKQLDRLATGLKVYGISKTNLKMIKISIPSKNEQSLITNVLNDMGTEIACLESKLQKFRQIKSGMMQTLLTGQIRLV